MFLRLFIAFALTVGGIQSAGAAGDPGKWRTAEDCFNAADYDCAFYTTLDLLREGGVVMYGEIPRATDSAIFLERSFLEAVFGKSPKEARRLAEDLLRALDEVSPKNPIVRGSGNMVLLEACRLLRDDECKDEVLQRLCGHLSVWGAFDERPLIGIPMPSEALLDRYAYLLSNTAAFCKET